MHRNTTMNKYQLDLIDFLDLYLEKNHPNYKSKICTKRGMYVMEIYWPFGETNIDQGYVDLDTANLYNTNTDKLLCNIYERMKKSSENSISNLYKRME